MADETLADLLAAPGPNPDEDRRKQLAEVAARRAAVLREHPDQMEAYLLMWLDYDTSRGGFSIESA